MAGLDIDLNIYPDENTLLQGLKQGDHDACTCLVRHFATRLYGVVLKIVPDPDDAETVVQTTMIKACQHMATFEERSQLGTWLYRIATNEALMLRRKLEREAANRVAFDLDQPPPQTQTVAFDGKPADPVAATLSNEFQQQLLQAVDQLGATVREVFLLRDVYGLSVRETAEQLGITENTVKVRLHRARQQLRQLLAPYVAEEEPEQDGHAA